MATQLVDLPPVERLSPRCLRILGGNPSKFTLQGTNTYLVGTGPRRILIDTGEGRPAWLASLKETLKQENATVETALITHWHHDHTGGIEDLLSLCPNAQVFKHEPSRGQQDIIDGQTFSVEGANLTAAYTPGHTTDHMVFLLPEEDAMFTADNVLGHGTAVFEDLSTYLASLDKMRRLFKGRAYPGHGAVLEDGPARITEYINHRQQREEQVVRTLRSNREGSSDDTWTPMELVKVIYQDVPDSLHIPAAGGLSQILAKLRDEGRAEEERGRWRLKDRPTL
ncbi:putative metallo-beta-lactamase superfamily protein [Paramyrothecium foliicola]|nr:putative metallo-beta-lactamase superfamily protein [Paramyrothecium foliicola]